jgi:protein SCO1/2
MKRLSAALLLAAVAVACREKPAAPARSEGRSYDLRGVVVEVHPERREIVVRHEAVAGYMPAMTMPFPVADDPRSIAQLAPGDKITAVLRVRGEDVHLEDLSVTGSEEPAGGIPKLDPAMVVRVGQPFPDFTLTDQDGRRVSLSSFRSEPVVVSFVYTRCPVSWACPMTLSKLARAAAKAASAGVSRFHILVVTMDPAYDTPRVLKDYSRQVDMGGGHWSFLTGDLATIAPVAEHLGLLFYREQGQITHSLLAAVVGADGRLAAKHEGRDWTPEEIAADLGAGAKPE